MGYKEWAYLYTPRYIEELNHVIDMHKELCERASITPEDELS